MRRVVLCLCITAGLTWSADAEAKDLRKRVGVGFDNQFGHITSLSVKAGMPTPDPAINLQVQATLGFAVRDGAADDWWIGGRALYGLVAEDNMNLYVAAGAGWRVEGQDKGLRLQPALGTEFFPFGLENLGISAEAGAAIDLGTGVDAFGVGSAAGMGIHYYF
ncbi:MAG: hypothetical protein GY913_02595 [Proteobacteria bacterium]|nr:hypothetical protein [Pseudomonadota bacterium]MCP4915787.1 hypothetical protein [Pseudomonadota bacterium]